MLTREIGGKTTLGISLDEQTGWGWRRNGAPPRDCRPCYDGGSAAERVKRNG